MADNKELKFQAVFDAKGAEKLQKVLKDLTQGFRDIDKATKDFGKNLQDVGRYQRDMGRIVDENIRKLNDLGKAFGSASNNAQRFSGSVKGVMGGGIGGAMQMQSGTSTYNGPVGGGPGGGGGGGGTPGGAPGFGARVGSYMMAGGAAIGGIAHGIGTLYDMRARYLEHEARQDMRNRTQGMEFLAGAQGFRNQQYMEAMSAPLGYQALKHASAFNLREGGAEAMKVDPRTGRLIAPDSGVTTVSYSELMNRAVNMNPEMQMLEAGETRAKGKQISGIGMAIGGGAILAGMALGGMKGAALGSALGPVGTAIGGVAGVVGGGVAAAGGASMLIGGFKEALSGFFEEKHIARQKSSGMLGAQQSDNALHMDRLADQLMAIQRFQMQAYEQSVPGRITLARQSMGFVSDPSSVNGFGYNAAEQAQIFRQSIRFGRAGLENRGLIQQMGNAGMDLGAASQLAGLGTAVGGRGGGQKTLDQVIAAGFAQGWKQLDMPLFERLGTAIADGLQGQGGLRSAAGVAALLTGGMGANPTPFQMQARQQAVNSGTFFQENGFFRSMQARAAVRRLGPNVDGVKLSALSRASFTDLMVGNEELKALGLTDIARGVGSDLIMSSGGVSGRGKTDTGAQLRTLIKRYGSFEGLQRSLNTSIQMGGEAAARAKQTKNWVSAVMAETLGGDFEQMRQLSGIMGVAPQDIEDLVRANRGTAQEIMGGRVSAEDIAHSKARGMLDTEAQRAGKGVKITPGAVRKKLEELSNLKSQGALTEAQEGDIGTLVSAEQTGNFKKTPELLAALSRPVPSTKQQPGYGSTQDLIASFGPFEKAITEVTRKLNSLVGAIDKAKPIFMGDGE